MKLRPVAECTDDCDVLPVALISLPDSTERRETLRSRGIPAAWVKHYWTATNLREAALEHLRTVADLDEISARIGRIPRAGEVGCAAAHRSVARWLANSRFDMVLILEDDAIPARPQFEEDVAALAGLLADHARGGAAFVCHLGPPAAQVVHAIKRRIALPSRKFLRDDLAIWLHADPVRPLWRAHAYLLSKGAAKRQQDLEPHIITLADDWFARRRVGLVDEIFFTQPTIIAQDEASTTTLGPPICPNTHGTDKRVVPFWGRVVTSLRKGSFSVQVRSFLKCRIMVAKARFKALVPYRLSTVSFCKDGKLT